MTRIGGMYGEGRRMARPMEFDRDEAIMVAMNVIWRDGYEAATVKSLSEQLGISRSSFYNTFGSREALLKLVLERYLEAIPERALMADHEGSLARHLTRTMRKACRFRGDDPERRGCLAANCIAELLPVETAAGEAVDAMSRAFLARLRRLVDDAVASGELAADTDSEGTALAIHGMIMGINLQSKLVDGAETLWRSAATTLKGLGLYDPKVLLERPDAKGKR